MIYMFDISTSDETRADSVVHRKSSDLMIDRLYNKTISGSQTHGMIPFKWFFCQPKPEPEGLELREYYSAACGTWVIFDLELVLGITISSSVQVVTV